MACDKLNQHGVKRKQWTRELLRQKKEEDRKRIIQYRCLVDKILNCRDYNIYNLTVLQDITQLLKINPEYNAGWNYRRDIISILSPELKTEFWENELAFSMALLKDYPKVYWIWNHRKWTLENYTKGEPLEIWSRELEIVNKLLHLDARNFHGWHYRRILVNKLENLSGRSRDKEELQYAIDNINRDISNYSAWHQKATLIGKMFARDEIKDKKKFVEDEFIYITNAIYTDAEEQSVWFYIEWFIRNQILMSALEIDELARKLQELQENILSLNEDDLQFSGTCNTWCLKILIVLEDVQKGLGFEFTPLSGEYLSQLVDSDPMRKNRYLHLLHKK